MINANNTFKNIDELKKLAIQLPIEGLTFFNPRWNTSHTVYPFYSYARTYSSFNNVLLFIDEKRDNYIIPYSDAFVDILADSGYFKEFLCLPISHGEFPNSKKEEWNNVLVIINQINWEKLRLEARKIAKRRNIQPLTKALLCNAIEIPSNGLKIKNSRCITTLFPLMIIPFFDSVTSSFIGTYFSYNNMTVIQSDEGRTYSLKYFDGIDTMLENLGYTKKEQYVPLSNGETIVSC